MVILLMPDRKPRLANRIRTLLEQRQAIQFGELSACLGESREAIRTELDAMRDAGEIERLRPVAFQRDEHDYYRLSRPPSPWRDLRAVFTAKDYQQHLRLAGEAVACLVD